MTMVKDILYQHVRALCLTATQHHIIIIISTTCIIKSLGNHTRSLPFFHMLVRGVGNFRNDSVLLQCLHNYVLFCGGELSSFLLSH